MPDSSKGFVKRSEKDLDTGVNPNRKNYLLAIAIDAYEHLPPLFNAVKDARGFVALLQEKYQFAPEYIIELYDQEATRQNIYKALDKLVQEVTPEDNLVLYFSGHGEFRDQMDEGYWIPVGAEKEAFFDFIPNQQIQHYLKRIKSHHSFVVVDSCFSGTLFANRNLGSTSERLDTVPSRWLLTSGRKELVSDGKPGDHSPFAENILLFLKNNQNSSLPISRLIDDVVHATAANARQTPRGEPIQDTGHKGGQFYFHLKRDEATSWEAALATNNVQAFLDFEAQFPDSEFVRSGEIDKRIAALEEEELWQDAKRSHSVSGYREYLRRTRLGKYREEANDAITGFRKVDDEAQRLGQEKKEAEAAKRKEAEEKVRKEVAQRQKKRENPPAAASGWNRLKLPLSIVAAVIVIVIAVVVWQVAKPSKLPVAWDCAEHYDQCQKVESSEGVYYLVRKGQLWGYVDEEGSVLVDPRYQEVMPFDSSGLALVKAYGKYGWIGWDGATRIPFNYEQATAFAAGKAEVKKDGETFFIETSGERLEEKEDALAHIELEKSSEEPRESTPLPAEKEEPVKKAEPKPTQKSSVSFSPPEMVFVKGGTFTMGCTPEQGSDCYDTEKPKHQVTVGDFKIGKYEVTQVQWRAVMGSDPGMLYNEGCDQCPVESISWGDVQEFLKKLNQKTGGNYRLPTEAEWEYAARGGQKMQNTKYAGSDNLDEVAWWDNNSRKKTHPVGQKNPNELGIYDMSGNVGEWCADHWHDNYNGAPTNGSAWVSGGDSQFRVVRGGSLIYDGSRDRSVSIRSMHVAIDRSNYTVGFRLAQD